MLEVEWDSKKGWTKPVISPLHHLKIHPAAKVLHYAIEVCSFVTFSALTYSAVKILFAVYTNHYFISPLHSCLKA